MFTGIITHTGRIETAEKTTSRDDLRLTIASGLPHDELFIGESIACNGACLTVTGKGPHAAGSWFTAELSGETVACTAPRWQEGASLNLERAMKLGHTLDGHIVTGHVDGIASIHSIVEDGDSHILTIDAPETLARFIAAKGSVTLDGVSLTVNRVEDIQSIGRFTVNIIRHTWHATTLGARRAGDPLNLEIDLIARYVARLLGRQ